MSDRFFYYPSARMREARPTARDRNERTPAGPRQRGGTSGYYGGFMVAAASNSDDRLPPFCVLGARLSPHHIKSIIHVDVLHSEVDLLRYYNLPKYFLTLSALRVGDEKMQTGLHKDETGLVVSCLEWRPTSTQAKFGFSC